MNSTVLSSDLFGDERGITVLSGNTYVAVIQKVESFIQLCLQTEGEATLIYVGTTVQHYFSWLRGVSETGRHTIHRLDFSIHIHMYP